MGQQIRGLLMSNGFDKFFYKIWLKFKKSLILYTYCRKWINKINKIYFK